MKRIDLCGHWEAVRIGGGELFPATVPGCVHTDLLSAGLIDDPFYRDNERKQLWVGESAWSFSRVFTADADFLSEQRISLRCEGLDTLAAISINGKEIARTDNMFRIWEFDVKDHVREGENEIRIDFDSPLPYIRYQQKDRALALTGVGHHRIDGGNRIRKSQANFGWDWGPMCVTCGIWRPIGLIGWSTARLGDVRILQDHGKRNVVELTVQVPAEPVRGAGTLRNLPLRADLTIGIDGEQVARVAFDPIRDGGETKVVIRKPRLWWPNGMGEQPLYELTVVLSGADGEVLDRQEKRVGLRTLRLERAPDEWGESFRFVVNGKPFFAKGANWIPADVFVTRTTAEQYEYLIGSAKDANMNMLRVWGGGIYEADIFYDLCDRYGICVWQDFMFACSAYPAFDTVFMTNVKREAEDTIRRLRHHACIALWCGNNEIEQIPGLIGNDRERGEMSRAEYRKLFGQLLPSVVTGLDPERDYWPSSPHTPAAASDANDPRSGDAHLWQVWHGREPFEWYRSSDHRFCSEFGFQSFPEPRVVDSFTLPEDRNISSRIMEFHQRSAIGNDAIVQYLLQWFLLPSSFEMLIRLSQILQGLAMKDAVEHWRRSRPRCMGTLYWQLNDCWPAPSWSSIDNRGNWKALHYLARDFYAPLLVSGVLDPVTGTVEIHVCSDRSDPLPAVLSWNLFLTDGTSVAKDEIGVRAAASASRRVAVLKLGEQIREHGERNLLLVLELAADGQPTSRNLVLFARPKHIALRNPEILASVAEQNAGGFTIALKAARPALWVWPELAGIPSAFSDRFFHLFPGRIHEVTVLPDSPISADLLLERLRVTSLFDTCGEYGAATDLTIRTDSGRQDGELPGTSAAAGVHGGSRAMRLPPPERPQS